MAPFVSSIEIDRPPAEVFGYVTDPARFAEWQADVVSAETLLGAPGEVGTTFTTTRRIGRSARTMTQRVTRAQPPGAWQVRGVDGPLRPALDLTIEPLDGGRRSRVTFALDFEGRGFADLLVPAVRRIAAKAAPASYRRLKERLET
jgi:uncharacterized protein YndB with AHSA1/START domain